ncbi:MAG: hypothetical protein FWF66_03905 [Candidatus Bathyarchaeota archaeon]|nr:hypothetical protein [Candidatus Termiticorpusculum sp.]
MNVRRIGSALGVGLAFVAVLSMLMSPGVVGFAAAEEEGCPPCVYLSGYACNSLGGNRFYCYAANAINCPVKWAALNIELWVDGVHIPPIDVGSPWSSTFQTNTGAITFSAWVTHQCNSGCCTCG